MTLISVNPTDLNNLGASGFRTNIIVGANPNNFTNSIRPYVISSYYGNSLVTIGSTDVANTQTTWPTASYYTEIIDMDSVYWKQFAKVWAVGDYGNRTLLLNYCSNESYYPFYPTKSQTQTRGAPVQWNNIMRCHRGSLRLDMSGGGPCHHRALEIEYNMGASA